MTRPDVVYHLLLRNGVGFDRAKSLLPHLKSLGVSHLYLSPIFTAARGSTHGYDVADPTEIDPSLGGEEGYAALAEAAKAEGMGIILDIVPNHTVLGPDNRWLMDVLHLGRSSRFAGHFDIDWSRGPILIPVLPGDFAQCAEDGTIQFGEDAHGRPALVCHGASYPLREDSWDGRTTTVEALIGVHQRQYWRLTPGGMTAKIRHRRFFNVTELIGMRVERPGVFEDMHAALFRLIERGQVQGLRIDHVDGLADPGEYLRRLADRVKGLPIWVEKILTGHEKLQDWPVEGTTGYEIGRALACVLTPEDGMARLSERWEKETELGSFEAVMEEAKRDILGKELSAELAQLTTLTRAAICGWPKLSDSVTDPELRRGLEELLVSGRRYRTYPEGDLQARGDALIVKEMAELAQAAVPPLRPLIDALAELLVGPQSETARALATRFEQVTGALLAKAQEDTAGYRFSRFIAASEVGAEPDEPVFGAREFAEFVNAQPDDGWVLTSSHDTKRSGDARMRCLAIAHAPEAFGALLEAAGTLELPARVRWYALQTALALWGEPEASDRLGEHMVKALREAKIDSTWDRPDEDLEARVIAYGQGCLATWSLDDPHLAELIRIGDALALGQAALSFCLPGIPYLFQGCEQMSYTVTDPDNRRPVPFDLLATGAASSELGAQKRSLLGQLGRLRGEHARFFRDAELSMTRCPGGDGPTHELRRTLGTRELIVRTGPTPHRVPEGALWPTETEVSAVSIYFSE